MMAQRMEWFTLHEITIARAEPKLAPARVTSTTRVEERMRGKVLAFYVLGITLCAPIGSLVQGALAEVIGPRATVATAGVAFVGVLVLLRARGSLFHLDDEHASPLLDPAPDPTA